MPAFDQISADQLTIGHEVEIDQNLTPNEGDVVMSNDSLANIFQNNSNASTVTFECDLSSPMDNSVEEFDRKPPKLSLIHPGQQYVGPMHDLNKMEVEPINYEGKVGRKKSQCNECGVYVINVLQHKRCVHDFSGQNECDACGSVFNNQLKLLMHKYYKHVPPRYTCEYCDKKIR